MKKVDLTVGTCIIKDKKILFVLHARQNLWLFPGGHINQNETPDVAALREAQEETGITDYIGFFAATTGIGIAEKVKEYQDENDDYNALMIKIISYRLVEAFS